jgi:hypothetical protein
MNICLSIILLLLLGYILSFFIAVSVTYFFIKKIKLKVGFIYGLLSWFLVYHYVVNSESIYDMIKNALIQADLYKDPSLDYSFLGLPESFYKYNDDDAKAQFTKNVYYDYTLKYNRTINIGELFGDVCIIFDGSKIDWQTSDEKQLEQIFQTIKDKLDNQKKIKENAECQQ